MGIDIKEHVFRGGDEVAVGKPREEAFAIEPREGIDSPPEPFEHHYKMSEAKLWLALDDEKWEVETYSNHLIAFGAGKQISEKLVLTRIKTVRS